MVSSAVYPGLERKPGGPDNWVERAGGLPKYIERIAKHLHYEKGFSISRAIATAVKTVMRWARMGKVAKYGDPNHKHVSAKTAALAAAAVASWEAKRAAGKLNLSEAVFQMIDLADAEDPQTSVRVGASAILLADIIDLAGSDVDLQQLAERAGGISDPAARAIARSTVLDLAGPPMAVREKLAKVGKARPDGGFPIRNVEELKKAIRAIGRAKDPAATKRYIKARAKSLGRLDLVPGGWTMDFSDPIDLSSSIPPKGGAKGKAKDGRPSYKRQGKWGHGFVPLDDAAKQAKAKGSPIAMKRMNRLFGGKVTGRAGGRSGLGRKRDTTEIKVSPGKKGPTERATNIGRLRNTKFEDPVKTKSPGRTNLKETSKQGRVPKRAVQNWDEIPDNLKTVRNGKRYVLAEFGGKQVITEWVGGVRQVSQTDPKKAKVMRTITAADASKLSVSQLKTMLANPRTPSSIRKALNKALRDHVVEAKAS